MVHSGKLEGYTNKLKNKLFGLLCEYERDGEWEAFLESILTVHLGWEEDGRTINYYILYYKLSSLKFLRYEYFRKTIFDCINLVDK
jgi:hypothetical protein